LWICLEGEGNIGPDPFRQGEVWLLPEQGDQPIIRPHAASRFLRTQVPRGASF
jgi:hypothetical protein